MARYGGQRLVPAEGFDLLPRLFCHWDRKRLIMLILFSLGNFWCSVVTLTPFRSYFNNVGNKNF